MPDNDYLIKTDLSRSEGNQPHGLSKATEFSLKSAVTLSIGEESIEALELLGHSLQDASDLVYRGFWKLVLTNFNEQHSEGHFLFNPVSDTFSVYTTGAMPIMVSLQGFLYMTPDQDHRMDFVKLYNDRLRGTQLRKHRVVIVLTMKDTTMRLRLSSVNMSYAATMDEWVQVSMNGAGFAYKIQPLGVPFTRNPAPDRDLRGQLGTFEPTADDEVGIV